MTIFHNILKKISLKELQTIVITKDIKKPQFMNRLKLKMKALRDSS